MKDGDEAIVGSKQEVICDFDMGGHIAVVGSETRLEGFEELMVGHVVLKLGSHCSFQDFTEEREVGDWTVVVGVVQVSGSVCVCVRVCVCVCKYSFSMCFNTCYSQACRALNPVPFGCQLGSWPSHYTTAPQTMCFDFSSV